MFLTLVRRKELEHYLHTYLMCDQFNDYAPNGLQIEGREDIRRICTAVTASDEVIKIAISQQADVLLVHHGYFWRGEEAVICGMKRRRIGQLMAHDINLFAYHLPLDCHPKIGNNACLGKLLGVDAIERHTIDKTPNLLWTGTFLKPYKALDLSSFLFETFNRLPVQVLGSDKPIRHIAWCSGAAQQYIENAKQLGVDAYLSGEISERTYYQAKELDLHYFSCGHHATERYGIQTLGEHLRAQFGIDHEFIDSFNPV